MPGKVAGLGIPRASGVPRPGLGQGVPRPVRGVLALRPAGLGPGAPRSGVPGVLGGARYVRAHQPPGPSAVAMRLEIKKSNFWQSFVNNVQVNNQILIVDNVQV